MQNDMVFDVEKHSHVSMWAESKTMNLREIVSCVCVFLFFFAVKGSVWMCATCLSYFVDKFTFIINPSNHRKIQNQIPSRYYNINLPLSSFSFPFRLRICYIGQMAINRMNSLHTCHWHRLHKFLWKYTHTHTHFNYTKNTLRFQSRPNFKRKPD